MGKVALRRDIICLHHLGPTATGIGNDNYCILLGVWVGVSI